MNTNWILNCPAPKCGQLADGCYNAGPMLANDQNGTTKEDSKMQLVFDVTEADFNDFHGKCIELRRMLVSSVTTLKSK